MAVPERSAERDAAVLEVLDLVPVHGWSVANLARAMPQPNELDLLFPGGTADLIETYCDLADRQMEEDMMAGDLSITGLTGRVRKAVSLRFARQRPHRDSIRRALSVLALPRHGGLGLRITMRTVDAIWHAAGDRSADFSWYSKRAILAGVYGATLLFWLRDYGEDDSATLGFLDRRLAMVGGIGKARARLKRGLARFRPGARSSI